MGFFLGLSSDQAIGIACMLGGAIISTFGYKFVDVLMSFFGSIMGAILVYWLSILVPLSMPVHITTSFIVSLILSFVCLKYKRLPCIITGLITSVWMANAVIGLTDPSPTQHFFIGLMFMLFPIIFGMVPVVCILASTSFYGSWLLVTGVNQFIPTGFPNAVTLLLSQDWGEDITCGTSAFLMGLLCFTLTILAMVVQFFIVNRIQEKPTWDWSDQCEIMVIDDSLLPSPSSKSINSDSIDDLLIGGETPYCDFQIDKSYNDDNEIPEETHPLIK